MGFNLPSEVYLPPELDGKAKNLHARMAVYFDNFIYTDPEKRNDTLLYIYLYHIIKMLAQTEKYFKTQKEYEDFANYMATKLYMRYINPEHTKKYGKIISVLNYCKGLLKYCKVDFQRDTFDEIIGVDNKGKNDGTGDALKASLESSIQQDNYRNKNITEAIIDELDTLPVVINRVLKEAHYKQHTELHHRLYMSILLSLVNGITLNNNSLSKIESKGDKNSDNDKFTLDLYNKESINCTLLWRLPNSYRLLVAMLVTKSRILFSQNIKNTVQSLEMSSEEINAVLMSAYGNTLRDDNEEV